MWLVLLEAHSKRLVDLLLLIRICKNDFTTFREALDVQLGTFTIALLGWV
jgi:hypothetical protein